MDISAKISLELRWKVWLSTAASNDALKGAWFALNELRRLTAWIWNLGMFCSKTCYWAFWCSDEVSGNKPKITRYTLNNITKIILFCKVFIATAVSTAWLKFTSQSKLGCQFRKRFYLSKTRHILWSETKLEKQLTSKSSDGTFQAPGGTPGVTHDPVIKLSLRVSAISNNNLAKQVRDPKWTFGGCNQLTTAWLAFQTKLEHAPAFGE